MFGHVFYTRLQSETMSRQMQCIHVTLVIESYAVDTDGDSGEAGGCRRGGAVRTHAPNSDVGALICTSRGWHVAITAFECSWRAKKPHRNFAVPVQPGRGSIYLASLCVSCDVTMDVARSSPCECDETS
jgi:hypothetical protein